MLFLKSVNGFADLLFHILYSATLSRYKVKTISESEYEPSACYCYLSPLVVTPPRKLEVITYKLSSTVARFYV